MASSTILGSFILVAILVVWLELRAILLELKEVSRLSNALKNSVELEGSDITCVLTNIHIELQKFTTQVSNPEDLKKENTPKEKLTAELLMAYGVGSSAQLPKHVRDRFKDGDATLSELLDLEEGEY